MKSYNEYLNSSPKADCIILGQNSSLIVKMPSNVIHSISWLGRDCVRWDFVSVAWTQTAEYPF